VDPVSVCQIYGFTRATGNKVEIVSAIGEGTTVEIWLPRADGATVPLSQPQQIFL
jgi:hypothetical protein